MLALNVRETEIQNSDGPVRPHLDVGRLRVAMDDPMLVCGLKPLGDFVRDRQRLIDSVVWVIRSRSVGRSIISITSAVVTPLPLES